MIDNVFITWHLKTCILYLLSKLKKPQDKEWQKIKYDRQSFLNDNSVGVNLKLSQVLHIDLENEIACGFGAKWLAKILIIGKI